MKTALPSDDRITNVKIFIKNEFNSELQQASDYLPAAVVKFKIFDLVVKLFV